MKFADVKKLVTDRPTDRQTDRSTDQRTDTPSYRDAWMHLKSWIDKNKYNTEVRKEKNLNIILIVPSWPYAHV